MNHPPFTSKVRGRLGSIALMAACFTLHSPGVTLADGEHPCGWSENGQPPAMHQSAAPFEWGSDATKHTMHESIYHTLRWVTNTAKADYMLDWAVADLTTNRLKPGWTAWRCDHGWDRRSAAGLICHGPRQSDCEESVVWKNDRHLFFESSHEDEGFNTLFTLLALENSVPVLEGEAARFGVALSSQASKTPEGFELKYEVRNTFGALDVEVTWPIEVARSFDNVRAYRFDDPGSFQTATVTTPRRPVATSVTVLLTTADGITLAGNAFIFTPVAGE